jgi:glycosyltransferase involved in cell wall biosynthesis
VIVGLRDAGLADGAELTEIWTTRWDDPAPLQALNAVRAFFALLRALIRNRPDVVHLHVSTGGSFIRKAIFARTARLFGVPVVAHLHSGDLERWCAASPRHERIARSLLGGARVVLVTAPAWSEYPKRHGATDVRVIPNGLSAATVATLGKARTDRAAPIVATDEPVVLYYGRWVDLKGPDLLGPALAPLAQDPSRPFHLRVFGNGDRAWIEQHLDALGARATVGGWLDEADKERELAAASVLVVPSRKEGFGQVLLEGIAAGVPIVASDAGAIPAVLSSYEPSTIFPSGNPDALRDALTAYMWPSEETIGATPVASPYPEAFTREHIAATVLDIYRELAGG